MYRVQGVRFRVEGLELFQKHGGPLGPQRYTGILWRFWVSRMCNHVSMRLEPKRSTLNPNDNSSNHGFGETEPQFGCFYP